MNKRVEPGDIFVTRALGHIPFILILEAHKNGVAALILDQGILKFWEFHPTCALVSWWTEGLSGYEKL